MSAPDTVHALLTTLFVGAALYEARRALVPATPARHGRVDHVLHAAMAAAMAAMPWGPSLPRTARSVFFTAAAAWFVLTPVCRAGESHLVAAARRLPHALDMAAMVWMLRVPHDMHHAMALKEPSTGSPVTAALALCLLTRALRSLTRDLPTLTTGPEVPDALPPARPYGHFWDGSMALGTVITLVMPH
ncbi:DUF5134 domain-containing protein [Streptomyces sp. NPDC003393]